MTAQKKIRYYYVDESGDLTLYNKKGQIIIGKPGVSKVFMIGVVRLKDPILAKQKLEDLRTSLLLDARFKDIPSMQPEAKKTALLFHAKNDHPEVRQEVFKILPTLGAKVQIVVRRKLELADMAKFLKEFDEEKLQNGEIYDELVTSLFTNMLHQADENKIIFARLKEAERREALAKAIREAKNRFEKQWKKGHDKPTTIDVKESSQEIGLQVIDYYLWALQRLYQKNDDSFFTPLCQDYSLILDLDDKRKYRSGRWYCKRDPLTLEKLKPLVS